jgi:PAS domain S-box-containing protein
MKNLPYSPFSAAGEKQNSTKRFFNLISTIEGIIWETTPNFIFTFVSKQAERILGYPLEQWQDPHFWTSHLHPDDRDWAIDFCKERCKNMQDHVFEYRMIAADGQIIWLRDLVHVVVDDGKLVALQGLMVDVTDHRKTADQLLISLSLLDATLESTADGILVIDLEGKITKYNQTFLKLMRISNERLFVQVPFHFSIMTEEQLKNSPSFAIRIKEIYQHPEAETFDELEFKDGRICECYSRPQRIQGKVVGRVWNIRDMTVQKQATNTLQEIAQQRQTLLHQETQARLDAEQAIKIRDDFISIAAHELRTPLTSIRICNQLMQKYLNFLEPGIPGREILEQTVDAAIHQVDRFSTLVERLLDVSRMRDQSLHIERSNFDLVLLVNKIIDRLEPELKKSSNKIKIYGASAALGNWDYGRIEQVIVNLLMNALKYGENRPIEVTVLEETNKTILKVKDQGIGIAKESREKIFQRFGRAVSIKNYSGFGLGLFISKEIIEAHGGFISFESEPGVGTTFKVELPRSL